MVNIDCAATEASKLEVNARDGLILLMGRGPCAEDTIASRELVISMWEDPFRPTEEGPSSGTMSIYITFEDSEKSSSWDMGEVGTDDDPAVCTDEREPERRSE